jgi:hypothetical protein
LMERFHRRLVVKVAIRWCPADAGSEKGYGLAKSRR